MFLMANGSFHESLTTDWAPGMNGSVRFFDKEALHPTLTDEKFWNFYRNRVHTYQPPTNNVDMPTLDTVQNDARAATTSPEKSGTIHVGTGGGKTLIFAFAIADLMGLAPKKKQFQIHAVVVPTLLLAHQTLWVIAFCVEKLYGKSCKYLVVNSADEDNSEVEAMIAESECGDIQNTTNPDTVIKTMREAKDKDWPLVVVSTYMSQHVLDAALEEEDEYLEMLVFDEGHNLVKGRLCGKPRIGQKELSDLEYANKLEKRATRVRYFTATPPKSFDGRKGFHLDGKYKTLYSITDGELILRGFITLIRPVYIDVSDVVKRNPDGTCNLSDPHIQAKVVKRCLENLVKQLARDSRSPETIAPRLLAKFPNSTHLNVFQESLSRQEMADEGVFTYTISCLHKLFKGDTKYDGSDFRHEYLKEQKELDSSEPSVTGYVQMLGEGIDVNSFNAILSFESIFDEITRKQTLGRGRRTNPDDRKLIQSLNPTYEEFMSLVENQKLNKPFCYVYIPMWNDGVMDYTCELKRLVKRDFSEMMGEIYQPILVKVNVPDELPAGAPSGGTFEPDMQNPKDHSNITSLDLNFTSEAIKLSDADIAAIKADIEAERKQKEANDVAAEEVQTAYEKVKAEAEAIWAKSNV
jgi:superfamily II DNA or RNA helicase